MKNLLRSLSIAAALVLTTACAGTKPATANSTGMVCVMSGEALDASSPSSDYMGQKVGFCCDKCQAKWVAMDDAGKKAKLAAMKK